jgi:hypothetical protein
MINYIKKNIIVRKYNSGLIRLSRLQRNSLRFFFKFDQWHISSLKERKYALDIIDFLNNRPCEQRRSAIEVGCGLGDIIRNLKFRTKFGLDRENNVLSAARFLNFIAFKKASFSDFFFPSSSLNGEYDVIIMVNWIHSIAPELLKQTINEYFTCHLLENGCIVIDTVQAENYKFNHDIKYLTSDLPCEIIKIGDYINQREVFAICK